jgi:hypothetical protein
VTHVATLLAARQHPYVRHLGDAHSRPPGRPSAAASPAPAGAWRRAGLIALLICAASSAFAQSYGELDTSFKIALKVRTAQPAGLEASIVSTTTYPCAGYSIRGSSWSSRDTIILAVHGMGRPSPCVSLPSEATGTLYLGEIHYPTTILRITYRGQTDLHRLTFAQGRVTTAPIRSRFTRVSGR